MLAPSMGRCGTPLTIRGSGSPAGLEDGRDHIDDVVPLARSSPLALMRSGQWTTMALRVPP